MKLSRTDMGALAAVVGSGALGVALFGPQVWGGDSITVDVTSDISAEWTTQSAVSADGEAEVIIKKKKVRRGDGTEEIVVTVETDGNESGRRMERRIRVDASGAEGEHVVVRQSVEGVEAAGENVFVLRTTDGPEPLVYIDGERVERSAMDELGPDRIDRVEVVKGEAAEKLFGPEASVGVIQIFTKEGSGS
jgi:predicted methyltransferase